MKSQEVAEALFQGMVKNDIVRFMLDNYAVVNRPEVRDALNLSNRTIAFGFSDANWESLRQYSKEKNLGTVIEGSNRRRWHVNNLCININKLDNNLLPSNLYVEDVDPNQITLDLGIDITDVSIQHPLVLGYISDSSRSFIKEIHVVKYKVDGSVEWNIQLYKYSIAETIPAEEYPLRKDLKSIIKLKTPKSNVVSLDINKENND